MNVRQLQKMDKGLLWVVCACIASDIILNYITSYGHIYVEGLRYGEYGVDARLNPIAIDLTLTALALVNVFATRFGRGHWLLRVGLGVAVAGTVAANAAYGEYWGMTGGLLAVWSPVAMFIVVESALYAFRIVADLMREAREAESAAVTEASKPRRGRPPRAVFKEPEIPQPFEDNPDVPLPGRPAIQTTLAPVIRGKVTAEDPFTTLRNTGQFPVLKLCVDGGTGRAL